MAGFVAANAYRGTSPGASPLAVMEEMSGGTPAFLVDVRTRREFEEGCLPEAINIPLEVLRERLTEIPQNRPVLLQCGTGYRS